MKKPDLSVATEVVAAVTAAAALREAPPAVTDRQLIVVSQTLWLHLINQIFDTLLDLIFISIHGLLLQQGWAESSHSNMATFRTCMFTVWTNKPSSGSGWQILMCCSDCCWLHFSCWVPEQTESASEGKPRWPRAQGTDTPTHTVTSFYCIVLLRDL